MANETNETRFCSVKTVSGSILLRNSSGKAIFFHSPRTGGPGNGELFLDKAAREGPATAVLRRIGLPKFEPSISGRLPAMVGECITQAFEVADGEVIKAFVTVRYGYGRLPLQGSAYLRVRAAAAHRRIRFQVTENLTASFTHAEIQGPLDILTLDELDSLGIKVLPAFRQFCSPEVVSRLITENLVIQPELAPKIEVRKKEVATPDGGTVAVFERKRRRAVDI
jgi:hypothetical protein